jgi:hypothetical protein
MGNISTEHLVKAMLALLNWQLQAAKSILRILIESAHLNSVSA